MILNILINNFVYLTIYLSMIIYRYIYYVIEKIYIYDDGDNFKN